LIVALRFDRLHALYGSRHAVVARNGAAYPAAIESLGTGPLDRVLRVHGAAIDLDPELAAMGAAHLARVRERAPQLHDGAVVVFAENAHGTLRCVRGSYFDMLATTDVLRAEYLAAGPEDGLALRDLAHAAAGGDPLLSGAGRAAAVGVTVVVTSAGADGPSVLLGRRRDDLGADAGLWHIPASGMVEPRSRPLVDTAVDELCEELGLALEDPGRLTMMGIGWDLLRLRPEVCLRLDLTVAEAFPTAAAVSDSEYVEARRISLTSEGMGEFWSAHPPPTVTPAAAAAIALLESHV
jgi:8-oxo-dGTP pyrophosphatase MutT (NUDIX family)